MKPPIVILGSSRGDGNTLRAVKVVLDGREIPIIDLNQKKISYFDYEGNNHDDDFIEIIEIMLEHERIILATPVYWYTMSAVMKTFIDRWSDLLNHRKDLGRRLRGKELYLITSFGTTLPQEFEQPFIQTCAYMGLAYRGCYYYFSGRVDDESDDENRRNACHIRDSIFRT